MDGTLRGVGAKVKWAKEHIRHLESGLGEGFLTFAHTTHPDVILREDDPQAGKTIYKVGEPPTIPIQVALTTGDVIHSLRSSLDHLIRQLIVSDRKTPAKEYFPVSDNRKGFESGCKAQVKGRVSKDAYKVIRETEAYKGGKGDALWRLHKLDIIDKHRLLILVGWRFRSLSLPWPSEVEFSDGTTYMLPPQATDLFYNVADTSCEKGTELFVDEFTTQPKNEPKFRLEVALNEPWILGSEPVLPFLNHLAGAVEMVVARLAAYIT